VFCEHKSAAQIAAIGAAVAKAGQRMLFTRLWEEMFAALPAGLRDLLDYDPDSGTAFLGATTPEQVLIEGIGIVAAAPPTCRWRERPHARWHFMATPGR